MPDDLNFQNFSTVQSKLQPKPNTIASATTIAPTTFITYVSGTAQVGTITPPTTGACMLVLIYTGSPGTMLTTGNISQAIVPTQNVPTLMFYDPALGTWNGMAGNLT